MNTKHQLLLVEDDSALGYLLSEYLKMKGFGIEWVKDGKQALKKLEDRRYDLCILDVMMPEMDGYALAEQIKSTYPEVPFIFLTAKSMKIDALKGLNLGAIDYLRKPIDEEELVMRLEILLDRNDQKNPSQDANPVYHIGNYVFSPRNQLLNHPDGTEIQMTHRESELLMMLVKSDGQLCKHKDILDKLWGKNDYFNRKSMSVFITRLRKYLAKDQNIHIENVHNQGFILKTTA